MTCVLKFCDLFVVRIAVLTKGQLNKLSRTGEKILNGLGGLSVREKNFYRRTYIGERVIESRALIF